MNADEFRKFGHQLVDWMADYAEGVKDLPVRSQVQHGDIAAQLPASPPQSSESFEAVFEDFKSIIMPGITHWQHPRFFAYFPSNASHPSQLADMLLSALGANAMLWETSPAATELEERMMQWLAGMLDLPSSWNGVIQDTASSATFCAVLAARERATDWRVNEDGLQGEDKLAFYTSAEAHSSVEKAVKMAGLGRSAIRLVPVDKERAMRPQALAEMIAADKAAGIIPAMITATVGTTGVGASDPLKAIGIIARTHNIYFHVDAAWAGTAMICPEYRYLLDGVETADSFLFNPHKWMGVNFDCTAHFVREKETLIRTLTISPAYLKSVDGVTDYRDWGIQLGRRARALKVWFVIRSYGVEGIQEMVRCHVGMTKQLSDVILGEDDFELVAGPNLGLLVFRYAPWKTDQEKVDQLNESLIKRVNDDGFTYLTRTLVDGRPAIRWSIGHISTSWQDVSASWGRVKELAVDAK